MRYLYFSMLLMGALSTQAQSKAYTYTYDRAGNRTARNVVYLRLASPNNSTAAAVQQTAIDSSAAVFDDISDELRISLFPNPTTKTVQVEYSNPKTTTQEQRLYGQNGKLLEQRKEQVGNLMFNLEPYPPGNYFIWLLVEDKVERFQVVKQ